MLIGMFGTGSRDLDRVIRNAFAGGEDGIWVAPRLGGMYQDAALATPWTADGQAVGGYVDRSPNGYVLTQATSAARPLGYGDRLAGDGADDYLTGGDILDIRTGSQFMCVAARFATGSAGQAIISKSNLSPTDGRYVLNRSAGGNLQTFLDNGAVDIADAADTSTALRVISAIHDRSAGLLSLRVNGSTFATKVFAPTGTDFDTALNFNIMSYDGASQFFNGDLHEAMLVRRLPAVGEIEAIEARIAEVHGITL